LHVNRSLYENLLAEIILLEERYAEKHSAGIPSLPTECYHDFYIIRFRFEETNTLHC